MLSDMARHPGVRAGGDRAAAAADRCRACKVSYDDPDYLAGVGLRSAGLRLPSVRHAATGTPETIAAHHARRSASRSTSSGSAPNNAILAIVGDVTAEEAFAGAERVFGDWERARRCRRASSIEPPRADAPRRRRRQARRGADRDPRRQHRHAAQAPRLHGAQPRDRRSSAAKAATGCTRCCASERGLTYGASADMQHAQGQPATSRPRPTRGRRRPAKCCG